MVIRIYLNQINNYYCNLSMSHTTVAIVIGIFRFQTSCSNDNISSFGREVPVGLFGDGKNTMRACNDA